MRRIQHCTPRRTTSRCGYGTKPCSGLLISIRAISAGWVTRRVRFTPTTKSCRRPGLESTACGPRRSVDRHSAARSGWWRSREDDGWFTDILAAQVAHYRPDVLLNQAMDGVAADFLQGLKPHVRLLVGQHASPLPPGQNFKCYDLLISSLPNLVEHFRRLGAPAELHRLGFEPRVLSHLTMSAVEIPVSFVGSISSDHQSRVRLLEHLCAGCALEVWGPGVDSLPDATCLRKRHRGEAWASIWTGPCTARR